MECGQCGICICTIIVHDAAWEIPRVRTGHLSHNAFNMIATLVEVSLQTLWIAKTNPTFPSLIDRLQYSMLEDICNRLCGLLHLRCRGNLVWDDLWDLLRQDDCKEASWKIDSVYKRERTSVMRSQRTINNFTGSRTCGIWLATSRSLASSRRGQSGSVVGRIRCSAWRRAGHPADRRCGSLVRW